MKLVPDIYLLNTFHITKNDIVNECAGEGRIQKKNPKQHKINKVSTLTLPNNSLQNVMKVGIFLMKSSTI